MPFASMKKKYGRWTVLRREASTGSSRQARYFCRCRCGTHRIVSGQSLRNGRSTSCGCLHKEVAARTIAAVGRRQRGPLNPQWKGGKTITKNGYVNAVAPVGHPRRPKNGSYVFEHVLVMEQRLGRYLLPEERVHHKNGVRSQNNSENLELWRIAHPPGHRVVDAIAQAVATLKTYAPEMLSGRKLGVRKQKLYGGEVSAKGKNLKQDTNAQVA